MTMPCCIACKPCAIPKDCRIEQDHGQVAGPLGDLAAPQLAFFLQLFERGNHHRQQLQNDRRRDVGHDAQRENRQPADVAAREQIEEAEDRPELRLKNSSQR